MGYEAFEEAKLFGRCESIGKGRDLDKLARLTCHTNGRFLRFRRARRRAKNFQIPARPDNPILLRMVSRLRLGAIAMRQADAADEAVARDMTESRSVIYHDSLHKIKNRTAILSSFTTGYVRLPSTSMPRMSHVNYRGTGQPWRQDPSFHPEQEPVTFHDTDTDTLWKPWSLLRYYIDL